MKYVTFYTDYTLNYIDSNNRSLVSELKNTHKSVLQNERLVKNHNKHCTQVTVLNENTIKCYLLKVRKRQKARFQYLNKRKRKWKNCMKRRLKRQAMYIQCVPRV